jgi:hypothetical protein
MMAGQLQEHPAELFPLADKAFRWRKTELSEQLFHLFSDILMKPIQVSTPVVQQR